SLEAEKCFANLSDEEKKADGVYFKLALVKTKIGTYLAHDKKFSASTEKFLEANTIYRDKLVPDSPYNEYRVWAGNIVGIAQNRLDNGEIKKNSKDISDYQDKAVEILTPGIANLLEKALLGGPVITSELAYYYYSLSQIYALSDESAQL